MTWFLKFASLFKSDKLWFYFAVVTCDPPPAIVDGTQDPVKDVYDYKDVVQYSCNRGLALIGSSTISCSADEQFNPSPPQCKSRFAAFLNQIITATVSCIVFLFFSNHVLLAFFLLCLQRLNVQTVKLSMVNGFKVLDPLMYTRPQWRSNATVDLRSKVRPP